jgi:3-oxoacyl-[acyl-carrier-protein] synthase-3
MKNKTMDSVGMVSLAVSFPDEVRTNDYFRATRPELVADAERRTLAKVWRSDVAPTDAFALEMLKYTSDPFRGTVERRVLPRGGTALSLEVRAAKDALAAAKMSAGDVDLMIVCSFLPDQLGIGNSAFLARELGMKRAAWNMETACSSALVAFQTACGLVRAGQYYNVLVVVSCTYSRVADESDTLAWFLGDGASAFVVSRVPDGEGLLGMHTVHTALTCDTFYYRHAGETGIQIQCSPETGKVLHETAEPYLRSCCAGAAEDAGVRLSDIDFFVFNTPTAWNHAFAARALGVDLSRTISTYPLYGNIGPALVPVNLHRAAAEGKIARGDRVLLYAIGSVSSASAAVIRWGEVALGPLGERPRQ